MRAPSRTTVTFAALILTLAGFWAVLFAYSGSPDLLLTYPFWWPDTFDWAKQSIVVLNRLDPVMSDSIFVWRPRGLIWLGVMSAALGTGLHGILLGALGVTAAVFAAGMFRLGRALGIGAADALFVALLLMVNYSFFSFSLYIMADFLAITAMVWVMILFVKVLRDPPERFGWRGAIGAGLLLGLSSCTQVFTLIPGFVFAAVYVLHARKLQPWRRIAPPVLLLGAAALVRVGAAAVKREIYGTSLDDRLKYLKLTTESLGFYAEALLVFAVPVLFVVAFRFLRSAGHLRRVRFDLTDLLLTGTIAAFTALIVSYSTWFEARLLTFFLPLLYLLLFRFAVRAVPEGGSLSSFIEGVAAVYLAMTPVNHIMAPHLAYYGEQLVHPRRLLDANAFSAALRYKGEDLRIAACVSPDSDSGAAGQGFFPGQTEGCDPYLHYNARVYWCYKHRAAKCFKDR